MPLPTSEHPTEQPPTADQLQLAVDRTLLAYERTLMAWIRTATSLITFGFTLYKFFFYLHQQDPIRHPQQVFGARTFGLLMIGIGVITLALATWQHWHQTRPFRTATRGAPFSLALVVAALIGILGVLGFFATILQA